jgi:peptidoglycan hydrolase-like protein with peptidoglycan-binding domain
MRTLILATASAIALGVAGASPIYAQSTDTNAGGNPALAAPSTTQSPSTGTMQPATPQAGSTIQETNPSATSGNNPSMSGASQPNNSDMASASQSSTDWPRISRNDVEQIQQKLQQEGLYRGKIDGLVGPGTQQALRAYQGQHGLPVTATLDPETLNSLNAGGVGVGSSTPPNSPTDSTMTPSSNAGANGGSMPANQH